MPTDFRESPLTTSVASKEWQENAQKLFYKDIENLDKSNVPDPFASVQQKFQTLKAADHEALIGFYLIEYLKLMNASPYNFFETYKNAENTQATWIASFGKLIIDNLGAILEYIQAMQDANRWNEESDFQIEEALLLILFLTQQQIEQKNLLAIAPLHVNKYHSHLTALAEGHALPLDDLLFNPQNQLYFLRSWLTHQDLAILMKNLSASTSPSATTFSVKDTSTQYGEEMVKWAAILDYIGRNFSTPNMPLPLRFCDVQFFNANDFDLTADLVQIAFFTRLFIHAYSFAGEYNQLKGFADKIAGHIQNVSKLLVQKTEIAEVSEGCLGEAGNTTLNTFHTLLGFLNIQIKTPTQNTEEETAPYSVIQSYPELQALGENITELLSEYKDTLSKHIYETMQSVTKPLT